MIEALNEIEVITLFVPDLERTKAFYRTVFGLPVVYEDANCAVMKFGGLMINLLDRSQAPALRDTESDCRAGRRTKCTADHQGGSTSIQSAGN